MPGRSTTLTSQRAAWFCCLPQLADAIGGDWRRVVIVILRSTAIRKVTALANLPVEACN